MSFNSGLTGAEVMALLSKAAAARTPVVVTTVTADVITPTGDTDLLRADALDDDLAIAAPSSTPADGWPIVCMFKDDGTERALDWDESWESLLADLPEATTAGKWVVVTAIYNADSETFQCMSAQVQA